MAGNRPEYLKPARLALRKAEREQNRRQTRARLLSLAVALIGVGLTIWNYGAMVGHS